ncbi:GNAT family N-acetyltransferase [Asticcacaulis excentricus]|uniref:GCN5-related N-acetyltransferase n=1 Tax=Asticcacaulis excentricus (strain ATCC 15261 / DSM 4724 / KCTC 12464 / NCIMB 9791 / VKM B-1370 / CB 48) TaxID=573065 RepID=E8RQ30_ASTEC|nr:GNAT family N-acetyltransferase [Asticcacaulis excentricus]ADU12087.1 GCN5-related N-acetyltransferase [Asticcacaulis excentricus CB 48]
MIRPATTADIAALTRIWEESVRAAYDFLSESDINFYRPYLLAGLMDGEVWVAEDDGAHAGFCVLAGDNTLAMLFIDPVHQRRGVGRALIAHACALRGPLIVEVNEQVTGNVTFYQKCGFAVTGRSDTDAAGNPYPIVFMAQ